MLMLVFYKSADILLILLLKKGFEWLSIVFLFLFPSF